MIQLHSKALVVCYPDGRMEPLDLQGILASLIAHKKIPVGEINEWVLEQMVESIITHFRKTFEHGTVPLSDILELTQALIVDYVNDFLSGAGREPELNLFEVAHRSNFAFELDFYLEIKRLLIEKRILLHKKTGETEASSIPEGSKPLRITGLRNCAKFLAGRRRWGKRSSEVRDEIISYLREEVVKSGERDFSFVVMS